MRIQEIEARTGITSHNIRYYEKEKLIFPQRNLVNHYREYTEADIEKLNTIKLLRMMNIPVKNIREYFEGGISLEEILENNLCRIEEKERQIKKSKLLNEHLLRTGINREIPSELLEEIFGDEDLYIETIEQIKKQDVWSARRFFVQQLVCIAVWLSIIIITIVFFFTSMANYVGKITIGLYVFMLALVFVLIGRVIYQKEKNI